MDIKYDWSKKSHNNDLYEEIRNYFYDNKIKGKVQIKHYPNLISLRGCLNNSYKYLVICDLWGYGEDILYNFDPQRGFDEWEGISISEIYIYK